MKAMKALLVAAVLVVSSFIGASPADAVSDTYFSTTVNGCTITTTYNSSYATTSVTGSNCGGGWHGKHQRKSSENSVYCTGSTLRTNYAYGTQTYPTANHCIRVTHRHLTSSGGHVYYYDHLS